jgi:hypothetical protein
MMFRDSINFSPVFLWDGSKQLAGSLELLPEVLVFLFKNFQAGVADCHKDDYWNAVLPTDAPYGRSVRGADSLRRRLVMYCGRSKGWRQLY